MGMFERLGEKVERFKQEAVSARDESADFRCRNCDSEIYSEQERCPECGSAEIERIAGTEPETTEGDTAADEVEEAEVTEEARVTEGTENNAVIEEAETRDE